MIEYVEGVDQPPHYGGKDYPYQPIHVIEAWGLGFCLGTALKYIGRAGRKLGESRTKDLQKALWYINRELEQERKKELKMDGTTFEEKDNFIHAVLPVNDRRKENQERINNVMAKADILGEWCAVCGQDYIGEHLCEGERR